MTGGQRASSPIRTTTVRTWGGVATEEIRAGRGPSSHSIEAAADGASLTLGRAGAAAAAKEMAAAVLGAGPLEPLLADPAVTDVLVNGDGSVYVDRGAGVEQAGLVVPAADLRPLATRLAGVARRRLDDAQPWVDGLLPGGVRLHAVLPPLVDAGPHLSLRIPRHSPHGVAGLEALGAVGPELGDVLRDVVSGRHSFAVVGGTGAGKTTVLGALLAECGPQERIVLVEDVRELVPAHPHVVRLQGRGANVEGAGEVTMVDLLRQALRMRPDRLVVGEVRGAEVRELLAALNTGHEGGAGTVHANAAQELPARLEALGALAGMPRDAVHAQLRGALQVVLEVGRRGGRRLVTGVGIVAADVRDGGVQVLPALRWDGSTLTEHPGSDSLGVLLRR